jgi:hypothetical protein
MATADRTSAKVHLENGFLGCLAASVSAAVRRRSVRHPISGLFPFRVAADFDSIGHLAHRVTPILGLSDRVCKPVLRASLASLLASRNSRQGAYKSKGYAVTLLCILHKLTVTFGNGHCSCGAELLEFLSIKA